MGPSVNKGMLQTTVVGLPVAIPMLMTVKLKKNKRHVISGMRNLNIDRERQERGCDEVNYADFFANKSIFIYVVTGGLKAIK